MDITFKERMIFYLTYANIYFIYTLNTESDVAIGED